jgi:thiosulfate sulfurtransferase
MAEPISAADLLNCAGVLTIIDVRKPKARANSGLTIPRAIWRHPFDTLNWWHVYQGSEVVVFCVHGHEVSQAVAGFLQDQGLSCRYLEGGFEAWRLSGGAVVTAQVQE